MKSQKDTKLHILLGKGSVAIVLALLMLSYLSSFQDWPEAIGVTFIAVLATVAPSAIMFLCHSERATLLFTPILLSIGTLLQCLENPKAISFFPELAGMITLFTSPLWVLSTFLAGKLFQNERAQPNAVTGSYQDIATNDGLMENGEAIEQSR